MAHKDDFNSCPCAFFILPVCVWDCKMNKINILLNFCTCFSLQSIDKCMFWDMHTHAYDIYGSDTNKIDPTGGISHTFFVFHEAEKTGFHPFHTLLPLMSLRLHEGPIWYCDSVAAVSHLTAGNVFVRSQAAKLFRYFHIVVDASEHKCWTPQCFGGTGWFA